MKKYAVIVAGGTGTRMGSAIPKQFMLLNGKPVLLHTIETFLSAYPDLQIILVLPAAFEEQGRQLILQSAAPSRIQMVFWWCYPFSFRAERAENDQGGIGCFCP